MNPQGKHGSQPYFEVGKIYVNRKGSYTILSLEGDAARVRYEDGQVEKLEGLKLMEGIDRKIRGELQNSTLTASPPDRPTRQTTSSKTQKRIINPARYYYTLGWLAAHARLEITVPARRRPGFEKKYKQLKGGVPELGQDNYYQHNNPNVWGSEPRISFNTDDPDRFEFGRDVQLVRGSKAGDEWRINNTDLFWDLIPLGFRLGDSQIVSDIRRQVPPNYLSDFDRGTQE